MMALDGPSMTDIVEKILGGQTTAQEFAIAAAEQIFKSLRRRGVEIPEDIAGMAQKEAISYVRFYARSNTPAA